MILDLVIWVYDDELLRVFGARVRKFALVRFFDMSPQFRGNANTLTGLTEVHISKVPYCSNSFKLI